MKILDRYVIRELVIPIIFCSASLIMLFLIADIFDNLSEMLRNKTDVGYIFKYYLNLIPIAFSQTICWATLLGTIFLLFNYNRHNEILAMKAAGLSIETIMVPMLYVGLVIGIMTFVINDRVVPNTYLEAQDIRHSQIEKNASSAKKMGGLTLHDVTYFSPENEIFYIQTFNTKENKAENLNVLFLTPEKKAERKVIAKEGVYKSGVWKLKQITSYDMDEQGKIVGDPVILPEKDFTEVNVTPKDLIETSRESIYLSYKELKGQIQKLKEHQFRLHSEEVELANKLASPWYNLVMILIAVPILSVIAKRKAFAINLCICFGVVLAFHITNAFAQALGKSGVLYAPVAAWFSNLVFATGALFRLDLGNR
ncbi:MAG: LptF/LptG family permease [Candidatus Omnitrophica bacterium]|nr:LptF/LptG family permease [Candidatus Omnitrophota bacterium]